MHQYLNKFLPVTFTGEWSTNAERRIDLGGPVLRNVLDFYVPNSRLVSSERQPLIHMFSQDVEWPSTNGN